MNTAAFRKFTFPKLFAVGMVLTALVAAVPTIAENQL